MPQHRRRVDDLGDDRRVGRAVDPRSMRPEQQDKDGVENDIQNS